jgi:hypothetical protein
MTSTLRRFRRALAIDDRSSRRRIDASPARHERFAARATQLPHLV